MPSDAGDRSSEVPNLIRPKWLQGVGRVRSLKEAEVFVKSLGFCTWAPIPGRSFPNLADAMGETAWSVMGRTWYWKDDVHFQRRLYYAKVIAGQPSFIAPDYLPDFVAGLVEATGWSAILCGCISRVASRVRRTASSTA